eukprot:s881_g15.t1
MNVPACVARTQQVKQLLDDFEFDVLALQETGVQFCSRSTFRTTWRRFGFHVVFGGHSDLCATQAVLLSRHAIKPIVPSGVDDLHRVACGIVEFPTSGFSKLLVGSLYAHANDAGARRSLIQQVVKILANSGLPWLLLGDYNAELCGDTIAPLLAAGVCHGLDDCFVGLPGTTRPAGRRRIDFGLASRCLWPSNRFQYPGLADHDVVGYGFEGCRPPNSFWLPSRSPLDCRSADEVSQFFTSHWSCETFNSLLARGSVDEVWTFLSDFAEQALSVEQRPCGVQRSADWRPTRATCGHKAASSLEPFVLRQVRRLHRQILQLTRQPEALGLREAIQKASARLGKRFPELSSLAAWNAEFFADTVASLLEALEADLHSARWVAWKSSLADNFRKQTTWVRKRADAQLAEEAACLAEPASAPVVITAIGPVQQLEEACHFWLQQWSGSAGLDPSDIRFQDLLHSLPQRQSECDVTFSGRRLLGIVKGMCHKACGPDAWSASQLATLPMVWWDAVASLWSLVYSCGSIPRRWVEAKVVLLPKRDGGFRPLSIVSILWRAGSKLIMKNLKPWILSWADKRLLGGIPERSLCDAHVNIAQLLTNEQHDPVVISQDIAKFFDSVRLDHVAAVLKRLGAPQQLISLLSTFYRSCKRYFMVQGCVHPQPVVAQRGLLQGCPFSPMLAGALMNFWLATVCQDNVNGQVFLDDRCFWPMNHCQPPELLAAKTRSDHFDFCFGFKCRGFLWLWQRLRLIRWASPSPRERRVHIGSLVVPLFAWAGGLASVASDDLQNLKRAVLTAFAGTLPRDAPVCLVTQLMGWRLDPVVAVHWSALRMACRLHTQFTSEAANISWPTALPLAEGVIHHLGWQVTEDGACISRTDSYGATRVFKLGFDNRNLLFDWLEDWHAGAALRKCGRVARSLHRVAADNNLAQGLVLDAPPAGRCYFSGHQIVYEQAGGDPAFRKVAMATGASFWFFHAGQQIPVGDARTQCLCGQTFPSRPHLLWNCPSTQDLRQNIEPPSHRAEERLLAKVLPEYPGPTQSLCAQPANPHVSLLQALRVVLSADDPVVACATDGSSKHSTAAWSVFIPGVGVQVAAGLAGEDQSSFRAEMEALLQLCAALEQAVQFDLELQSKQVFICSDCESALAIADGSFGEAFPLLARRLFSSILRLREIFGRVTLFWVPSHNKVKPGWHFPSFFLEQDIRAWNAAADKAARECVEARLTLSSRSQWHRSFNDARDWEVAVVQMAALVHKRYGHFVSP